MNTDPEHRNIPFVSLQETHAPIKEELYESVRRVVDSGYYINGPETKAFAEELSSALGLGTVIPVSNGLDAIRLILRGYMELGLLNEGDEVMLPANTYIASLLPVTEFRLKPLLVKPDLTTFGLDWQEAERLVSEKTKAIISVHLYGTPSWDFNIADRLREKNILLIEDNAQAIGASINNPVTGEKVFTGALGDAAAFSFYPTKNIGAMGDAGAVATSNKELAGVVKALANYGSTLRYHNDYIGYNCRMDEIQAAVLRVKLKHLHRIIRERNSRARLYDSLLKSSSIIKPAMTEGMQQVWHQYVIRSKNRESLRNILQNQGYSTDIHYPVALMDQKCYKNTTLALDASEETRKMARQLAEEVTSLPIANITDFQIEEIAELINHIR